MRMYIVDKLLHKKYSKINLSGRTTDRVPSQSCYCCQLITYNLKFIIDCMYQLYYNIYIVIIYF